MHPRVFTFRVGLSLTVCASLLVIPDGLLRDLPRVTDAAQRRDSARPKPGKPEGVFPSLEAVKQESRLEREASPPIQTALQFLLELPRRTAHEFPSGILIILFTSLYMLPAEPIPILMT